MPVVPAPPEEAMPRMEMLLVPEVSTFTPGVKRATSRISLMPRSSMFSWVSAVMLIGTFAIDSSRRVAVTVISCKGPAAGASVACACSCDQPASGPAARHVSTTSGATVTAPVRRPLRHLRRIAPPRPFSSLLCAARAVATQARAGHSSRYLAPSSSAQRAAHRQCADPLAGGGVDRITERGGGANRARLTHPARSLAARHQMRLDARRLSDPQRREVVEVALLNAAVGEGNLLAERRAQAERHATLELRAHAVRIDHLATIHRAHHALDPHLALLAGADLCDLRQVAPHGELNRYAAAAAGRQRRAPPRPVGRKIENGTHARRLEQRPPILHRVLLRRDRELVDEALDHEDAARGPNPAPPRRRHASRIVANKTNLHVGRQQLVDRVGGGLDCVAVDAVLDWQPVIELAHRGTCDSVAPAEDVTVLVEGGREPIDVVRPVAVMLDILFARPQHPQRPLDMSGDAGCEHDPVNLQAPPKTPADQMVVQKDLLASQAERRELRDRTIGDLGAGPDLAIAVSPLQRAVHRLECRVGEEGLVIDRLDPRRGTRGGGGRIPLVGGDDAALAHGGLELCDQRRLLHGGVGAVVPTRRERLHALHGRPGIVRNDRNDIRFVDDLPDSAYRERCLA